MYDAAMLSDLTSGQRVRALLMFNKANGKFIAAIGWNDPTTLGGHDHILFIEEQYDFINDKVVGDYPDYKVMDQSAGPQTFYESQADAAMSAKITKRYPVVEQVNVLARAVAVIADKLGVSAEISELTEMVEYIKLCKDVNASTKEFYSESPDFVYISNEQLAAEENAKYEGGLHEAFGPREISGGRVFG
ncbi:hypothetical protein D9M71_506990 [compost metagenome]